MAKFTVQVNFLKELPKRIVSGFSNGREIEISVSYPWLQERCADYNAYGHDSLHCSRKPSLSLSIRKNLCSRSRQSNRTRRDRSGRSQGPTYRPILRCSTEISVEKDVTKGKEVGVGTNANEFTTLGKSKVEVSSEAPKHQENSQPPDPDPEKTVIATNLDYN